MKHPLKQSHEKKLDSLVESARYEVHDKFAEEKAKALADKAIRDKYCLLYTSPSPRDGLLSRMPSSA